METYSLISSSSRVALTAKSLVAYAVTPDASIILTKIDKSKRISKWELMERHLENSDHF